ncbi:hypothetical protein KJ708_14145 [bacterium]|nr:hypothetical protein [bacterium]MBU1916628.1 hypothetical protein [bacterium]
MYTICMGVWLPTNKAYTAEELADIVMNDSFRPHAPFRFDVELSGMTPEEQEAFIQMSVQDRALRLKVDKIIEHTYENSVVTGRDNFDVFIGKRDEALSQYLTKIREHNKDPQNHLLACDPTTWFGRIHSQDAFCEDPDERAYYNTSVTDIINAIYESLPSDVITSYNIKEADIPRDMIEVAVIKGSWNADFLEEISHSISETNTVTIYLVFKDESSEESAFYSLKI